MKTGDPFLHKVMVERVGAECVDELFARNPALTGERADYLMRHRSVVVEVKELKTPPYDEVFSVVHQYAKNVGMGVGYVQVDEVIRLHPRGAELNARLNEINTRALRRAIEGANGQIRATKRTFKLNSAVGLVFVLNVSNVVLNDMHITSALLRQLGRTQEKRFESVQHVVVLTPHHVVADGPLKGRVLLLASQPRTSAEIRAAAAAADIARHLVAAVGGDPTDALQFLAKDERGHLPIAPRLGEAVIAPAFVSLEEIQRAFLSSRDRNSRPDASADQPG